MRYRVLFGALVLAAVTVPGARAQIIDYSKYPDLHGQWRIVGGPMRFDTNKPWGPGQQAPLIPEYQAIFDANLKDQAAGGQGTTPTYTCVSPGMPRVTNGYGQTEFVITPDTTYIMVQHINDNRRIYTDGRGWPTDLEPSYLGYSIGHWIDTQGSGVYDTLAVETRGPFKGPRAFDSSGIPLHADNQTVIREKIYLDTSDRAVLHDEVTVEDHALTRPWTVLKSYRRNPGTRPFWREVNCAENNNHVELSGQSYMLSADGLLMPTKKDQPPPDLRYFGRAGK